MIKIKTKVEETNDYTTYVNMEYEVRGGELGEYIAILDKVKEELLENSNMSEEMLKEILFGKEEENE